MAKPTSAERRRAERERLQQLLQPCPSCASPKFRVSASVYLSDFRLVLCEGCGRTDWYAANLDELLARPEFERKVRVKTASPYR